MAESFQQLYTGINIVLCVSVTADALIYLTALASCPIVPIPDLFFKSSANLSLNSKIVQRISLQSTCDRFMKKTRGLKNTCYSADRLNYRYELSARFGMER